MGTALRRGRNDRQHGRRLFRSHGVDRVAGAARLAESAALALAEPAILDPPAMTVAQAAARVFATITSRGGTAQGPCRSRAPPQKPAPLPFKRPQIPQCLGKKWSVRPSLA